MNETPKSGPRTDTPRGRSDASKGARVRIPPPLLYAVVIGLGVVLERWHRLPIPLAESTRTILGWGLGLVGMGLAAGALNLFRKTGQAPEPWKPTPTIITSGVYRWTRNPMYLGLVLIQLWMALGFNFGWIALLAPVSIAWVSRVVIRAEEAYLTEAFGQPYVEYCESVRRWL